MKPRVRPLRLLVVCLGVICAAGPAAAAQKTETAHLIVEDAGARPSPEQLERFAATTESSLQKAIEFWAIPDRFREAGRIRLELHPEYRGHAFAVFQLGGTGAGRQRIVRLYGVASPQELVHKLTHALFPTEDKLVRNMMGIATEEKFGNPLSFPLCGRSPDAWAAALRQSGSLIALRDLGEDHESWGMAFQGQVPVVSDRKRQHASYAEAGSFGAFLLRQHGVETMKAFYRASLQQERPWARVFGTDLAALESGWLKHLEQYARENEPAVRSLAELWRRDAAGACDETQGTRRASKTERKSRAKSR